MLEARAHLTSGEVAAALRRSRRWFYAHRAQLEAEGFPRPISSVGNPLWAASDLIAWIERPKFPPVSAPPVPPGGASNVVALAARLAATGAVAARKR